MRPKKKKKSEEQNDKKKKKKKHKNKKKKKKNPQKKSLKFSLENLGSRTKAEDMGKPRAGEQGTCV